MNAPLFEEPQRTGATARRDPMESVIQKLSEDSVKRVRFVWADLHGETRCKTLQPAAARRALKDGIYVAGTTFLKDTADRTALKVFDRHAIKDLPAFANAANVLLRPDPNTFNRLPWDEGTAWMLCDVSLIDGSPCELDSRQFLKSQIARLAAAGFQLRCGIELEFHVYKLRPSSRHLDPDLAQWPGPAPEVDLLHPGYRLLSEQATDAAHEVLELIEATAIGLGMPLSSLEIEFGPSQFEAVFEVQDAQDAADTVVLFRSAIRQVLSRHGYLATFACRPPFEMVMSSGWHLHQSLVDIRSNKNIFADSARSSELSPIGKQWLAGLMHHAMGACMLGTTTANGYARFKPDALAPTQIFWDYENRSALFRVVGHDQSLRIENRLGEPSANPYLYLASQIVCGLNGIDEQLVLPNAGKDERSQSIPSSLHAALKEFEKCSLLQQQLGRALCRALEAIKSSEWHRFNESEDKLEFQRREYFARF